MKYHIKTADGWFISGGDMRDAHANRRTIFDSKWLAVQYVRGTNAFGKLTIVPEKNKERTINSLAYALLNRYPLPLTAWQIGKAIKRNPASVSSALHKEFIKGTDIYAVYDDCGARVFYGRRTKMAAALAITQQLVASVSPRTWQERAHARAKKHENSDPQVS